MIRLCRRGFLLIVFLTLCVINVRAEHVITAASLTQGTPVANGMIRVYLSSISAKTTLNIAVSGNYSLNGDAVNVFASGDRIKVTLNTTTGVISLLKNDQLQHRSKNIMLHRHDTYGSEGLLITETLNAQNPYPGDLLLLAQMVNGVYRLYAISYIFIEDYLYGVLPYEMGNTAPVEALKAQAVAARTYAFGKMKSRTSSIYDVVDTVNDQVYRGTPSGNDRCKTAIDATRGIVASLNGGELIEAFYTASNGGQTESSLNAWGVSRSYLQVKNDPFDLSNTDAEIRKYMIYTDFNHVSQKSTLKTLLLTKAQEESKRHGYTLNTINRIDAITPHTPQYASPSRLYTMIDFSVMASVKTSSGRLTELSLNLSFPIFTELKNKLSMGINVTNNELWSIEKDGSAFIICARRYGHGVGLSQRGAMQMGRLGYSYAEILAFYYQGVNRTQYTFTRSILPSVTSNMQTPVFTQIAPALVETDTPRSNATVNLYNMKGMLGIYSTRDLSSVLIGAIPDGAPVYVRSEQEDWCFVTYAGTNGYVQKAALDMKGSIPYDSNLYPSVVNEFATVRCDGYLNLRQGPSINTQVIGSAPNNAIFSVKSTDNGWAYIQYGLLTAYASTSYLVFSKDYPAQIATGFMLNERMVSLANPAETVNMRSAASLSSTILSTIKHGSSVTVLFDDGIWSKVEHQKQQGYIMSVYLTPQSTYPQSSEPDRLTAWVDSGGMPAPVREAPEDAALVIHVFNDKAQLTVLQYGSIWSQVQRNEEVGYIKTAILRFAPLEDSSAVITAIVNTVSSPLNLRAKASAGSMVLCTIPRLSKVAVIDDGPIWTQVRYNSYIGYVMSQYLIPETSSGTNTVQTDAGSPLSPQIFATVTTPAGPLNLRQKAESHSPVLAQIPRNMVIAVTNRGGQWSSVIYNGILGYAASEFLFFLDKPISAIEKEEGVITAAYVNTESGALNLRSSPIITNNIIISIPRGTRLEILNHGAKWCCVSYSGKTGYVMTNYLSFETKKDAHTATYLPLTAIVSTQNGGPLNLRSSENGTVLIGIPNKSELLVYEKKDDWCAVEYRGIKGYVMTIFIDFGAASHENGLEKPMGSISPGTEASNTQTNGTSIMNSNSYMNTNYIDPTLQTMSPGIIAGIAESVDYLHVYKACHDLSDRLIIILRGEVVSVLDMGDTWSRVEYANHIGYCFTKNLKILE